MQTIRLPWLLKKIQPFDFPSKLGLMDSLYGKSLAKHGICWVDTAANIPWKLDLANPTLRWIVYGKYEGPGFLNWAKQNLPANGVMVDSGANIGQILLYISQWIPKGKVLAFEPYQKAADWLEECLQQNPTLPVTLIRKGLGAKAANVLYKDEGSDSKIGAQGFVSDTGDISIEIVRLSDELKRRNIQTVDLWKLDVEGYEVPALEGAEEYLENKRIKAIWAEVFIDQKGGIARYLGEFGYKPFDVLSSGKLALITDLSKVENALFLP